MLIYIYIYICMYIYVFVTAGMGAPRNAGGSETDALDEGSGVE